MYSSLCYVWQSKHTDIFKPNQVLYSRADVIVRPVSIRGGIFLEPSVHPSKVATNSVDPETARSLQTCRIIRHMSIRMIRNSITTGLYVAKKSKALKDIIILRSLPSRVQKISICISLLRTLQILKSS